MPVDTLASRVYAELWISFGALIRSYVAGHDLSRPAIYHGRVDLGEDRYLTLTGNGKILALEFDAAVRARVVHDQTAAEQPPLAAERTAKMHRPAEENAKPHSLSR